MKKITFLSVFVQIFLVLSGLNLKEISLTSPDMKETLNAKTLSVEDYIYFSYIYIDNSDTYLGLDIFDKDHNKIKSHNTLIQNNNGTLIQKFFVNPKNEICVILSSSEMKELNLLIVKYDLLGNILNDSPKILQSMINCNLMQFFEDESYLLAIKNESNNSITYSLFNENNQKLCEYRLKDNDKIKNKVVSPLAYSLKTESDCYLIYTLKDKIMIKKFDLSGNLKRKLSIPIFSDEEQFYSRISFASIHSNNIILMAHSIDKSHLFSISKNLEIIKEKVFNHNFINNSEKKCFKGIQFSESNDETILSYFKITRKSENDNYSVDYNLTFESVDSKLDSIKKINIFMGSDFELPIDYNYSIPSCYRHYYTNKNNNLFIELTFKKFKSIYKVTNWDKPELIYKDIDLSSESGFNKLSNSLLLVENNQKDYVGFFQDLNKSFYLKTLSSNDSLKILKETTVSKNRTGYLHFQNIIENKNGYFVFWYFKTGKMQIDLNFAFIGKDLQIKNEGLLFSGNIIDPMTGLIPIIKNNDSLIVYFGQDSNKNTYEFHFDANGQLVNKVTVPRPGNFNYQLHYQTDNGFMRCYYKGSEGKIFYDLYVNNKKVKEIQPLYSLSYDDMVKFQKGYLTFWKNNIQQCYIYGHEDELIKTDPELINNICEGKIINDHFIFLSVKRFYHQELTQNIEKSIYSLNSYNMKSKAFQNHITDDIILHSISNDSLFILSQTDKQFRLSIYNLKDQIVKIRSEQIDLPPQIQSINNHILISTSQGLILLERGSGKIYQIHLNRNISFTDISDLFKLNLKGASLFSQFSFKDHEIFPQINNSKIRLIFIDKK